MIQSSADSCLYIYRVDVFDVYILVYVDDILVASASIEVIEKIEQMLKINFEIENLGEVSSYLGIRVTRHDGCYFLDQQNYITTSSDWNQVKRLIKYLKGTSSLRLKLGGIKDDESLIGFADANWAEDNKTRKSNSGYIFLLGGSISWSCKRQDCVAMSSTEAEFISLSEACRESIWIQRLLHDFNWGGQSCTKIYEDNQSVLKLIVDEKLSNRTKHIDTKTYFVKDHIDKGSVVCEYCPTETMLADLLTKGLPKTRFIALRDRCNLIIILIKEECWRVININWSFHVNGA